MHQSTTFPPAVARAFAQGYGLHSKAMAGRQSRNTQRSSTTPRILLQPSPEPSHKATACTARLWPAGNRKSRILAHIERNMAKLFIYGA